VAVAFSITLSFANQEKQAIEAALIHRALEIAKTDVRAAGGKKTSGNIVDGSQSLGTWTYTPGAAS
jgi:hypothetical protein